MSSPSTQRWGSDVIVDLIKAHDFPYAAINPGSSFRGLHDSLVNYGGNVPEMLLCPHEEIAVQIAPDSETRAWPPGFALFLLNVALTP